MTAARVLVVDDHDGCRAALVDLVEAAGFEVAGTADSGEAACAAVVALAADLVLLVSETLRSGADVIAKSALTPSLLRDLWRVRAPSRPSHRLPADVRDRSLGAG
jgi:DNA-binding NarL/FixJ family response regulator